MTTIERKLKCSSCGDRKTIFEFPLSVVKKKIGECTDCRAERRRKHSLGKCYSLRKYGITLEIYRAILKAQKGKCAICGSKKNTDGKSLHVDHCHRTKTIRGVLCRKCNTGIALLGDSKAGLKRALKYLEGGKINVTA